MATVGKVPASNRSGGYGVCARAGYHCSPGAHKYTAPDGAVRISFSVFNTKDEAERFIDIIKRISRS